MGRVYISGKIGEDIPSADTRRKFASAERYLRALGYDVFNPVTSGLGAQAEMAAQRNGTSFYSEILLLDLLELKRCDVICLLPDWNSSPGAVAERYFAAAIGIEAKTAIYVGGTMVGWGQSHWALK